LGSSHPCEIQIRQERVIEFRFLDILLPDSTANELNSHGFISFSVKPKINLPSPVIIQNRANIHFDFNDAILTNTVSNKLVDPTLATKTPTMHSPFINLFPNPAHEEIIIEPNPGLATELHYTIIDGLGNAFFNGRINPHEQKHINILSLPSGVYGIKVNNGLSSSTIRFVKP
ncbi:MAG TPA: T9SS type A sorting domain-containing protein, partial [Saprospiraceae bacterium]|nr:T9SS type A sorting domain-containing protein [Saprospiraceae bacterium]